MKKVFFVLILIPAICIAEELKVPMEDIFKSISSLISNFRGLSGIGIAAAILTILIQFLKTDITGNLMQKLPSTWRRILITILGQIGGIVIAANGGLGWVDSIIAGLLTSGGAVAIYEALKPLLAKKKNE